jgi:hypothetical protein
MCCFRVEKVDDGNANKVEDHEDKESPGANVGDPNREELGCNNGTNGTSRCCKIEASSSKACRKYLLKSVSCNITRYKTIHTSDPYTQLEGPNPREYPNV